MSSTKQATICAPLDTGKWMNFLQWCWSKFSDKETFRQTFFRHSPVLLANLWFAFEPCLNLVEKLVTNFQLVIIGLFSQALSHSRATRLQLLPNLFFFSFLPAISPRLPKGSQPNFPCRWQMGWDRKCGVKFLKYVRVMLGAKMSLFGETRSH